MGGPFSKKEQPNPPTPPPLLEKEGEEISGDLVKKPLSFVMEQTLKSLTAGSTYYLPVFENWPPCRTLYD